jgi:hypothetical protein
MEWWCRGAYPYRVMLVLVVVLESWSRFCEQDPSIAVNEIDSTPWLTGIFEHEHEHDEGLPKAVRTEVNQTGAGYYARDQKNPIHRHDRQT